MGLYKHILLVIFILSFLGCASLKNTERETFSGSPYFENPPNKILFSDKELFTQALNLQFKGQLQSAIELWQKFLAELPQSFEALNNLGMAYYSNDQLNFSIQAFESALDIKPEEKRIKSNLARTLRFRVTLGRENRQYAKAITDLQKILQISDKNQKEKILRDIELVQEKIFEEVQKLDSSDAYENFLTTYPDSVYASKAKKALKLLNPNSEIAKEPAKEFLPLVDQEEGQPTENKFEEISPLVEDKLKENSTLAVSKNSKIKMGETSISDSKITLPKMEDLSMKDLNTSDIDLLSDEKTSTIPNWEPLLDKADSAVELKPTSKTRQVKVITKRTPLNIRSKPLNNARIIGKVKKGAVLRLIGETSDWYYIAYAKKKTGWISRKFSKEIK